MAESTRQSAVDRKLLEPLPYWAIVAFVARCGRRIMPLYSNDKYEPADQREAVIRAVRVSEERAKIGGDPQDYGKDGEGVLADGQYFDNYDIDALKAALAGAVNAAGNTYSDLSGTETTKQILAAISLAALSVDAAFVELSDPKKDRKEELLEIANVAASWVVDLDAAILKDIVRDLSVLRERSTAEKWTDASSVPPDVFGEFWPEGRPAGWPRMSLSFRPRARIIRTIGDRLISGPEAAVIELLKNSHDADAAFVRITFVPPLKSGAGGIIVEDDGHGMTFEDIQEKWMEPATSDKKERKRSPSGRAMLGSKGIGRFAAARLGRHLEMVSSAQGRSSDPSVASAIHATRLPDIDWNAFEEGKYLEDLEFPIEVLPRANATGTTLNITELRDDWTVSLLEKLYSELRRLVSPIRKDGTSPFRIFLDLSQCTPESCGFDGSAIVNSGSGVPTGSEISAAAVHEVHPFPILDASDYTVDGAFDELGYFSGTMSIGRAGQEPEKIQLTVPVATSEESCGVVLVRLHIFDREASAVRHTAEKAGFGTIGIREARKLLDSVAGVAIYREGFRIRPYGDGENDWLTLDAKRVQNPTIKIGRNQIAGVVDIEDESTSNLVERSSREGLEENGSFRRLHSLISTLLSEVVEPRRRQFRIQAGLEAKDEISFRDVYNRVQMGWSKLLVAKMPAADRPEAEALITKESNRLADYLRKLESRQAQLEAQVTLGQIVGEVMHQGNTPLSFLETESDRLRRWWPTLLESNSDAAADRAQVPRILNGMSASSEKLRLLFNALTPLSGARRGSPLIFKPSDVVSQTRLLFQTKLDQLDIEFSIDVDGASDSAYGYPDDLATAATNLIDNAIYWLKHHKIEEPSIKVNIDALGDKCRILIADNGVGIPSEFTEQIFDIGFTLKTSGTGLGLSIAKEAISRSNGDLELIASAAGATFSILLASSAVKT